MHYTSRIILDNKLQMLKSQIYRDIHPITEWETRELLYPEALRFEPVDDWHPIAVGGHWMAQFDHTQMFRATVTVPESFAGKQPLLVLDLGGEGQIRIDGKIVSGIVSYEDKRGGLGLFRQNRSRVVVPAQYGPGDSHGIPWRCLLPKGVENLVVAGRSICMERMVLAAVRVMPNCLAMGEAAGIGAAIAARENVGIRQVDVQRIIAEIK